MILAAATPAAKAAQKATNTIAIVMADPGDAVQLWFFGPGQARCDKPGREAEFDSDVDDVLGRHGVRLPGLRMPASLNIQPGGVRPHSI